MGVRQRVVREHRPGQKALSYKLAKTPLTTTSLPVIIMFVSQNFITAKLNGSQCRDRGSSPKSRWVTVTFTQINWPHAATVVCSDKGNSYLHASSD